VIVCKGSSHMSRFQTPMRVILRHTHVRANGEWQTTRKILSGFLLEDGQLAYLTIGGARRPFMLALKACDADTLPATGMEILTESPSNTPLLVDPRFERQIQLN